jgi:hypothetical protein
MPDSNEDKKALANLCKDLPAIRRTLRSDEEGSAFLDQLVHAAQNGGEVQSLLTAVHDRLQFRGDHRGLFGRPRSWGGTAARELPGPDDVEFRCPLGRCSYMWRRGESEDERRCSISGQWPEPGVSGS